MSSEPNRDRDVVVACVTAPTEEAEALARSIVEARVAACVNLVSPMRSIYRWEGEIEDEEETLLLVKTTAAAVPALIAHVQEQHSYDTPEVIALPAIAGSRAYLDWVLANVD